MLLNKLSAATLRPLVDAAGRVLLCAALGLVAAAHAQSAQKLYPARAPLTQYLSESQAVEIELARSAAPTAISSHAEILVLDAKGYSTAVPGQNGFTCLVERSWNNYFDGAEFWNPVIRAPICYNAPAARSVLPSYLKRTQWVMDNVPIGDMAQRMKDAVAKGAVTAPETGAMSYMMSPRGYLSDAAGHAHPHLMFYLPRMEASTWGANLHDVPVTADPGIPEPLTVFFAPMPRWSDGTPIGHDAH